MKPLTRAALAAALACASSAAFSQATANVAAQATNFGYTLTDLDPGDGITPQLTWTQFVSKSQGVSSPQFPGTAASPAYANTGIQSQFNQAGSDTQMLLDGAGASTSRTGAASSIAAPSSGAWQETTTAQGGYFTLSANTAVTFTTDASLSLSGTVAAGTPPLGNPDWSYYYAYGRVSIGSIQNPSATDPGYIQAVDEQGMPDLGKSLQSELVHTGGTGQSFSQNQQLSLSFQNATHAAAAYSVGVGTYSRGYTVSNAIPEPGTWVLTALGLAAAGCAARARAPRRVG